jgi:hypothetical protein
MSLSKAVALGMFSSIATSFLMRGIDGQTGELLAIHRVVAHEAGLTLHWSWPVFCGAVVLAWPLFKMTEKS